MLFLIASPARPITDMWTSSGALSTARTNFNVTLLPLGKVLVSGGSSALCFSTGLSSAELFDPEKNPWSATGSMNVARVAHIATLLSSGKVLVVGGAVDNVAELYDPASGSCRNRRVQVEWSGHVTQNRS